MSFKTEVIADRSGKWVGNDLCFATEAEATAYVRDLMWRWLTVTDTRTVAGDWPVTHMWNEDTMKAERIPSWSASDIAKLAAAHGLAHAEFVLENAESQMGKEACAAARAEWNRLADEEQASD